MTETPFPAPLDLFPPTRADGLARLAGFVPKGGRAYAERRNHDLPGHADVSRLSPYIRHRLVTEGDVVRSVLQHQSPQAAEKFLQEVFWRTYWKGWLEQRPSVWTAYREGVRRGLDRVQTEAGLRAGWQAACTGDTGIECFDHWARELSATGYLHNHARMWFASIWIFTLRLPWELGADFFLRHLLDGDPASNTLGWRWVAGLQTPGKTYLATAGNIARYTGGRFDPAGQLAEHAAPVDGPANPPRGPPPQSEPWTQDAATGLVLTEDDLSPGTLLDAGLSPVAHAVLLSAGARSPLAVAPHVHAFTRAATEDALGRIAGRAGPCGGVFEGTEAAQQIADWAERAGLAQVVMPYPPVGPSADLAAGLKTALAEQGIRLVRPIRAEDARAWPHATHGFFRFKDRIPDLTAALHKGAAA
ncbi:FAD-binding domain-containing protein [Anianabacter salinae]|uniref:FAD-binding domain-containing protein n=1 Tax=Anianabacter salinae TaxID=2851023 RepID=UPI00225E3129|nr:FAD-binding domain-containing protein [Anianabacter salinae]MBV0912338.1 DNA photolyase [Anianabacter salinae]